LNNIPAYTTNKTDTGTRKVRFLFESIGKESIVKAIEYSPIKTSQGTTIFNLGFGDYIDDKEGISDDINSNNGDMRRVFSTVLSTVPIFFSSTSNSALWVQGSDSDDTFRAKCILNCTKNCSDICKNQGRRIKAYRYYVDKNFTELCKEYIFFGLSVDDGTTLVQYVPGSNYQGILIYKKK